jgi:hypothetical protein
MAYETQCSNCRYTLYLADLDDDRQGQVYTFCCPQCQFLYGRVYGTVTAFTSTLEIVETKQHTPTYRRRYGLRLRLPSGHLQIFEFVLSGKTEKSLFMSGDRGSVVFTTKDQHLLDLVSVTNHTLERTLLLTEPGQKAQVLGWNVGWAVAAFTLITSLVCWIAVPDLAKPLILSAVPLAVGAGWAVTQHRKPKVQGKKMTERLLQEQHYQAQICRYHGTLNELKLELASTRKTLERFQVLRRRMHKNIEIYESRLPTVDKAIKLLDGQGGVLEKLIQGYSQMVDVFEIELETLYLTETLPTPDNLSDRLLTIQAEMKTLEAQKEQLCMMIEPTSKLLRD